MTSLQHGQMGQYDTNSGIDDDVVVDMVLSTIKFFMMWQLM